MSRDTLQDTYLAALQHDLIDIPEGATLVGVVRSPTRWFSPAVDENQRAVGPPQSLLELFKQRSEDLESEGLDDADAHDTAWEDIDFEPRYRKHLETNPDAQAALENLRERLQAGEDLVLVCYENTEKKRCHRTILREVLEEGV
ncbi:MAG: DUF488 domain-containing protein [Haloarculaceae archaeon]